MLNIISRSIVSKYVTGPQEVVTSLVKGLDLIGYPYVINHSLDSCKRLWIHDDTVALKHLPSLPKEIKVVIGPNLYILPRHIPKDIKLDNSVYIQASPWIIDLWKSSGFNNCPLACWPAGIDTTKYQPSNKNRDIVLIYFKNRFDDELEYVKNVLNIKDIPYKIIKYGFYKQKEYIELLDRTKYLIWIGRHETQGIALEEAMAMNIPILLWDVRTLGHWSSTAKQMKIYNNIENSFPATSAHYFSEECGIKFYEKGEVDNMINKMEKEWKIFSPRNYVLNNLNLEEQAKKFIELYDNYYNLSFEDGMNENVLKIGRWRNAKMLFKIFIRLKDLVKLTLKLIKKGANYIIPSIQSGH